MDLNLAEIASVLDAAKGNGYFEDQLSRAFVPFFDKIESISTDNKPFTIADIFQINSSKFNNFKKRYEKALDRFIDNFENKVDLQTISTEALEENVSDKNSTKVVIAHILPKVLKSLNMGVAAPPKGSDEFKTERADKVMPVHIASIHKDLLEKMGSVAPTSVSISRQEPEDPTGKSGGLFKWLLKAGVGVAAFAAGAALLFEAFMTDGRMKGTLAIIGKSLIKPAAQIFDGLIKTLLSPISRGFDGLMSFVTKKLPKTGIFKIAASAFKLTGLKALGKGAGKGLVFAFKRIPILGTLISFGFAYSRFKSGDTLGGVLEIAAGIAAIFPAIGTAISAGIGVFLAIRDVKTTREQRSNSGNDFTKGIRDWFMNNKLFKAITNIFKGVFGLFTAKTGDDVDDAIDLLKEGGEVFLGPAIGWIIATFDFFKKGGASKFISSAQGVFTGVGTWFSEMFSSFVDKVKGVFSTFFGAISESLIFRKIKNKFATVVSYLKLSFMKGFSVIIDVLNTIPKALNSFVNDIIDGANKIPFVDIDRVTFGQDGIGEIDTTKLQKDFDAKIEESLALEKESRDREARKMAEKKKAEDDRRHQELLEASGNNTQALIDANSNNTQAVVASTLSSNNAPERGNTTIINNNSASETTRSLRNTYYEQTYGIPAY